MGKHSHTLKTLRGLALEHAAAGQPDLASLARELGRIVHQSTSISAALAGAFSTRSQPFRCWSLAERRKPPVSVILMAWSPNHVTAVHQHAGLWALELTLVGAIEVQSYSRDAESGALREGRRDWLGPGDSTWFEDSSHPLHRGRNLSSRDTALTLRISGGHASQRVASARAPRDPLLTTPGRSAPGVQH